MDNGESYAAEPVPLCNFKLNLHFYSYGHKNSAKGITILVYLPFLRHSGLTLFFYAQNSETEVTENGRKQCRVQRVA